MVNGRKTSLAARQRARQALQEDMERLKKREVLLAEVLTAVDARDAAEVRLGEGLNELRELGMSQAELAGRTGLGAREVASAMRAADEEVAAGAKLGEEDEHSAPGAPGETDISA